MHKLPNIGAAVDVFRSEAHELLQGIGEALLRMEKASNEDERSMIATETYRNAHNIKGAAALLEMGRVAELIHKVEDVIGGLRDKKVVYSLDLSDNMFTYLDWVDQAVETVAPGASSLEEHDFTYIQLLAPYVPAGTKSMASPSSSFPAEAKTAPSSPQDGAKDSRKMAVVRISQEKLDLLFAQVGDLVEVKIRMEDSHRRAAEFAQQVSQVHAVSGLALKKSAKLLARGIEQDIQYMTKLLADIHDELRDLRMVPCLQLFPFLQRAVRDVCRKRGLNVNFSQEGGEYEIDRKTVEDLKAPLVHLLRNAVDHGIESAELRQIAGKPAQGRVYLRVVHQGNEMLFEVGDDGQGIDYDGVFLKGLELGLLPRSSARPPDAELERLLFHSGMSTRAESDTISGRGVGLDAVKKAVEKLRGSVQIVNHPGKGTTFRLAVPLTLASEVGLLVRAGNSQFVVPRSSVERVVIFGEMDLVQTGKHSSVLIQGQPVPLAQLMPTLGLRRFVPREGQRRYLTMVLRSAEAFAAIVFDELIAESDIVVRDLGTFIQHLSFVSGLTISTSGDLFFVLNPAEMVRAACSPDLKLEGLLDAPLQAGAESLELAGKVILVVDDSVTTRMLNQKLLGDCGYQVSVANSGTQALELLLGHHFDLVLSDVDMPQMDGYELTRRIKADPRLSTTPVILLTAMDTEDDKAKGLDAGADAYLLKREMTQMALQETIAQLI